ncbi:MAG: FtsB family cell division protein [Bacillota bacterium]
MAKKAKNKKKKFRFFAVFLVLFMAFMVYKCCGQVYEINKLNAQKSDLEGTYAEIQDTKEELEKQKALLNDDTYLERLARENLLMVRDGEYLVVPYEENSEVIEYDGSEGAENEDVH